MKQILLSHRTNVLMFIAFFLPLVPLFSEIGIALLGVSLLLTNEFVFSFKELFKRKILLIPAILFLVYVFGILYTQNLNNGFKDLLSKLPLLLLPLFLATARLEKSDLIKIGLSYAAGVLALGVLFFSKAIYAFSLDGNLNVFFYAVFTQKMHPTYFSIFVSVALIFLLEIIFVEVMPVSKTMKWFLTGLFLFGIVEIILASSRMAIIATIASILPSSDFTSEVT